MSLKAFQQVWDHSPLKGQKLLLHLALADAASSTIGGDCGDIEISDLAKKCRVDWDGEVYNILNELEVQQMLEYQTHCEGESYESITYTLWPFYLEKDTADERAKQIVELPINGYVYILKSSFYYKIGKTKDINNRLKQLAIQLPEKIELLHTIGTSDAHQAERFFHDKYVSKRLNGEWFRLDDHDVHELKALIVWHPKDAS